MISRTYATRANAVRAARAECRALFGPAYQAHEGPDYLIHPESTYRGPSRFDLSPALRALLTECEVEASHDFFNRYIAGDR